MIYEYLNLNIKKVESINAVLNDAINTNIDYIDEVEDLEDCKRALVDFMLITREQMNLLHGAIGSLHKFNNDHILNVANKPGEHINPLSDIEFKKQRLNHRY